MQAPKAEAANILQRRFPVPRLVDCDQNGSQVRHSPHQCSHMWDYILCREAELSLQYWVV